jgi:hypothetical protein
MQVIQEITNGVADCPVLMESEHEAMMFFAFLAKQHGVKFDYDSLGTYSDKIINDLVLASEEQLIGSGYELKWWETEIK